MALVSSSVFTFGCVSLSLVTQEGGSFKTWMVDAPNFRRCYTRKVVAMKQVKFLANYHYGFIKPGELVVNFGAGAKVVNIDVERGVLLKGCGADATVGKWYANPDNVAIAR